jgi:outer membrane receptor protein involved in Fe transport
VSGYEINYDQQLRNLPRPFNTLAVFANYTRVHTSGVYDNGINELQLFIPKIFNVGFSYSYWRVQFRASYNYTGGYLNGANANPLLSNRSKSADNLDFNLQYRVTSRINASINVANLFNKWPSMYTIYPSRLTQTSVYGTRITLGVNGRL